MTRKRTIGGRDQRASAFSAALLRLCDTVGAPGAALVDAEGETVDYAGTIDPFDIKVAAAEWVVVLSILRGSRVSGFATCQELVVRGTKKSFFAHVLEDGYAVVVQLPAHAFAISRRGVGEAIRELCTEAGLRHPEGFHRDSERWSRVEVRGEPRDSRRPSAVWINGGWSPIEILGRWSTEGPPREVGFRARLPNGAELTLVRERLGRWYCDSTIAK